MHYSERRTLWPYQPGRTGTTTVSSSVLPRQISSHVSRMLIADTLAHPVKAWKTGGICAFCDRGRQLFNEQGGTRDGFRERGALGHRTFWGIT